MNLCYKTDQAKSLYTNRKLPDLCQISIPPTYPDLHSPIYTRYLAALNNSNFLTE